MIKSTQAVTKGQIMEAWKDVVGYEGRYEVSNLGNVRSLKYRGHDKVQLMKPTSNQAGYLVVTLGSGRKQHRVHCLVLEAFVGPRPDGMQGCHNDSNKANCALGNLRWDTPKGNIEDRRRYHGDANPNAKITDETRAEIRRRRQNGEKLNAIASDYGISAVRVSQIASGPKQSPERHKSAVTIM